MDIFVFSDESGTFDKVHNDYFVFAGVILLGRDSKEEWSRRYLNVEKTYRVNHKCNKDFEIKADLISNKDKGKFFRSLNQCCKFAVIIRQKQILDTIWKSKKDKQRYLDFAYKMGVKNAFKSMLSSRIISSDEVENIYFHVDEHTTATNGRYELAQSLEQEFKFGTYNWNYSNYFKPIFTGLKSLTVDYCNSAVPKNRLIRASDIIANHVYHLVITGQIDKLTGIDNMYYKILP